MEIVLPLISHSAVFRWSPMKALSMMHSVSAENEYEFLACRQALSEGLLEPHEMPHSETLYIM